MKKIIIFINKFYLSDFILMVFEKTRNESCCLRFIFVGWSDRDGCNLIGIGIRSRMVKLSRKYLFSELIWYG